MVKILAIDPGNSTGLARLDTEKEPVITWVATAKPREKLWDMLATRYDVDVVVIEDYINRPSSAKGFDHTWDKGATHRVIGSIEHWAWEYGLPVVFQQPTIKAPTAAQLGLGQYSKLKPPLHQIDAIIHGYKYILDNNLLPKNKVYNSLQGRR